MTQYKLPEDMCSPPCHHPDECHDWHHDPGMPHDRKHDPKMVMKCGTGSGFVIPIRNQGYSPSCGGPGYGGPQFPPMVAGLVSINTDGMRNPMTKIDFSSMINFKAESWSGSFDIKLVFQLSKMCNGGSKMPLGTWIYEKEVDVNRGGVYGAESGAQNTGGNYGGCVDIEFKEPFSFTWCECSDCPGCCTYMVELVYWDTDHIECASVTNVGITAIATSC